MTVEAPRKRICTRCKVEKLLEVDFNKDKNCALGYKTYCKVCRSNAEKASKEARRMAEDADRLNVEELKRKARGTALKVLVENHQDEYEMLVTRYYQNFGVIPMPRWVEF